MELRSEKVLADCLLAITKHTPNLQGAEFRISWWTVISLLRAIGNVLQKVDSEISEAYKRVIREEYQKLEETKPKPEIYWQFIKAERDSFLKKYDYGVRRQLTTRWNNQDGSPASLSVYLDDQTGGTITSNFPGVQQESFLTQGPFKGSNEQQIAYHAYTWWKNYIQNIKSKADSV
jgi:hypothetical protein